MKNIASYWKQDEEAIKAEDLKQSTERLDLCGKTAVMQAKHAVSEAKSARDGFIVNSALANDANTFAQIANHENAVKTAEDKYATYSSVFGTAK